MKLHLGCGKRFLPGFVHVDLDDFPHIDHRSSIASLDYLSTDSVSEIYSSHSFEYFDRSESRIVLKEWFRVLQPGGIIRLAVPDFDSLVEIYLQTKDISKILGPLFGEWAVFSPGGQE